MLNPTPCLLFLSMAATASAQVNVYELFGAAAGDNFGKGLVNLGDVDGDGVDDLLVSAPRTDFNGPNSGSVYAFSGASGVEIYRVDGTWSGGLFGDSVDSMGDVNGDGINDWVAGAPFASTGSTRDGRAAVHSGADGALLTETLGGEAFGNLGTSVAGIGDVNGDGVPDYVASAPFEDVNGQDAGMIYVHSGTNSGFIRAHFGPAPGDRIGLAVLNCGDVNGDGITDYAGGSFYPNSALGRVSVWSGQSGALLQTFLGTAQTGPIGTRLASLADMDGDGRRELAIAAPDDVSSGSATGAVYIYSVSSGALVHSVQGQAGQTLGLAVADAGDWDGNGQADWIVGRQGAGTGGSVVIYSGNDASVILEQAPTAHNDLLGSAFAGGFDLNGDSFAEYAVGDPSANWNGNDSGSVVMVSSASLLGTAICFGDGTGTGCPCENIGAAGQGCGNSSGSGAALEGSGSASAAADDLELHLSGAVPSTPCLLFTGVQTLNGGNGDLLGDGLLCAGGAIQRIDVRFSNGSGNANWGPGLGATQGWDAGLVRVFQVWYRDNQGSPCGANFNLSGALFLQFGP